METTIKRLSPAVAGVLSGVITYYFMYGWYDIFPWAVVALAVGYFSVGRRNSMTNGAIFGYFLFLVYIFAGYKGKTDTGRTIKFILFDLLFSLAGAVAGAAGSALGNWFKQKLKKPLQK